MNARVKYCYITLFFIALSGVSSLADFVYTDAKTDTSLKMSAKYKPETFYGSYTNFFNNDIDLDKVFYARHILDFNFDVAHGAQKYEKDIMNFRFTLRNKANWGNINANGLTTESTVKIDDTVFGAHSHLNGRLSLTLRELWLSFDIGKTFGLTFDQPHIFQLGLFPFELGRGISLGSAYATGPGFLGFYSDAIIDQFAPGAKISGTLLPEKLTYDIYAAILENLSTSLAETGAKVYAQEFDRRYCPERGFGKINFLVAQRFKWTAFDNDIGKCVIEPYWLYNYAPEQRVEFRADANSKLATVGMATDFTSDVFDLGFEWAVNLGRQHVKGWDRNQIEIQNIDACLKQVNSHVVDQNSKKILHDTSSSAGKEAQGIINSSKQNECENGMQIGQVDGYAGVSGPVDLINSKDRFRNPYNNKYEGWMVIADTAIWAHDRDLCFGAMVGAASGDDNPNTETMDGNYKGFIGLQEIYSGDKVKSAFVLGGAGKPKRFLSQPNLQRRSASRFSPVVSGFTNIVFAGAGMKWEPQNVERKFTLHPNIIAYWQEHATRKFDIASRMDIDSPASTYLGLEFNTFFNVNVKKNLKFFVVWSTFLPGTHYKDIQGKPLNKDQLKALDRLDSTGFSDDRVPNIRHDIAFTLNLGLEFKF